MKASKHVREIMRQMGAKGGKSKSKKKLEALTRARAALAAKRAAQKGEPT